MESKRYCCTDSAPQELIEKHPEIVGEIKADVIRKLFTKLGEEFDSGEYAISISEFSENYPIRMIKAFRKTVDVKPIIRCKDCKWWDRKSEDSPMGYCHACKHGYYSRHWEINIHRTYEADFFCADAEPKEEEEEDE